MKTPLSASIKSSSDKNIYWQHIIKSLSHFSSNTPLSSLTSEPNFLLYLLLGLPDNKYRSKLYQKWLDCHPFEISSFSNNHNTEYQKNLDQYLSHGNCYFNIFMEKLSIHSPPKHLRSLVSDILIQHSLSINQTEYVPGTIEMVTILLSVFNYQPTPTLSLFSQLYQMINLYQQTSLPNDILIMGSLFFLHHETLSAHLDHYGFDIYDLSCLITSFFRSFFLFNFSPSMVLQFYDIILFYGFDILLYYFLSLFMTFSNRIMDQKDHDTLHSFLYHFTIHISPHSLDASRMANYCYHFNDILSVSSYLSLSRPLKDWNRIGNDSAQIQYNPHLGELLSTQQKRIKKKQTHRGDMRFNTLSYIPFRKDMEIYNGSLDWHVKTKERFEKEISSRENYVLNMNKNEKILFPNEDISSELKVSIKSEFDNSLTPPLPQLPTTTFSETNSMCDYDFETKSLSNCSFTPNLSSSEYNFPSQSKVDSHSEVNNHPNISNKSSLHSLPHQSHQTHSVTLNPNPTIIEDEKSSSTSSLSQSRLLSKRRRRLLPTKGSVANFDLHTPMARVAKEHRQKDEKMQKNQKEKEKERMKELSKYEFQESPQSTSKNFQFTPPTITPTPVKPSHSSFKSSSPPPLSINRNLSEPGIFSQSQSVSFSEPHPSPSADEIVFSSHSNISKSDILSPIPNSENNQLSLSSPFLSLSSLLSTIPYPFLSLEASLLESHDLAITLSSYVSCYYIMKHFFLIRYNSSNSLLSKPSYCINLCQCFCDIIPTPSSLSPYSLLALVWPDNLSLYLLFDKIEERDIWHRTIHSYQTVK